MENFINEKTEKMSQAQMYYYYILLRARYLSHKDFSEIEDQLSFLAKAGCISALSSYFAWQKPELWSKEIKEIATNSAKIDDENNLPEQWELLMNLHRYDSVGLYGYENITNYQEFVSDFLKIRDEFASAIRKTYLMRVSRMTCFDDRDAYNEAKNKYDYFYAAIKNRPFTKCLINAQMGYFKRFLQYGRLSDYEAGLRLLQGTYLFDNKKDKTLNLTSIPTKVLEKLRKEAENIFQRHKKEKRLPIDSALAWSNIKQIYLNRESRAAEKMIDYLAEKPTFDENIVEQERVL